MEVILLFVRSEEPEDDSVMLVNLNGIQKDDIDFVQHVFKLFDRVGEMNEFGTHKVIRPSELTTADNLTRDELKLIRKFDVDMLLDAVVDKSVAVVIKATYEIVY